VQTELIRDLFKTEYSKILAVLCKLFGSAHLELAEDIVNDTFLAAMETWDSSGIPENPAAWLYTVAKNKTKDHFKRDKIFFDKVAAELLPQTEPDAGIDIDLSVQNIADSQLQMIFVVCNPVIPQEAQIGLALRILCGFGIEEIAAAFLTNKENISKRLYRAREKLRTENIIAEVPASQQLGKRLEAVLLTFYLLFNEGYYSSVRDQTIRKELCLEAMRLTHLLLGNALTNTPAVNALMSLMCFHASRFEARVSARGENILYEDQDRSLWDDGLIARGHHYLIESARGEEISKYHLEASIAYWHATKIEREDKWQHILQLYNKLLLIDYSPILALNRTYALAKANGKAIAIVEAEKLSLADHHLYHSLLGYLYTDMDNKTALVHYEKAMGLARNKQERLLIAGYIRSLEHSTMRETR
jgi:RNA polymerase sigma factor (sigma-70 family)